MTYFSLLVWVIVIIAIPFLLLVSWIFDEFVKSLETQEMQPGDLEIPWREDD